MKKNQSESIQNQKRVKNPFIYLLFLEVALSLFGFIASSYENTVVLTEKAQIMSADYMGNSDSHSETFFLESSDDPFYTIPVYRIFVQQENGGYLPEIMSIKEASIIKDIGEGEPPYLTREVTRSGKKKNTVLHLPEKIQIIEKEG